MPAIYWVPLPRVAPPVKVEHLHAALSRWFDRGTSDAGGVDHRAQTKPYTISPLSGEVDRFGVEVSVLTAEARDRLTLCAGSGERVRLGERWTIPGRALLQSSVSWGELAEGLPGCRWDLEFVTPGTFRTGNRSCGFPVPSSLLRSPAQCWNRFSSATKVELSHEESGSVWVSDFDIESVPLAVKGLRVGGVMGRLRLRCDDASTAAKVGSLLRLAEYCGVGSYRTKGFGIVRVRSAT
ncbi:CRISPR system precrRNA processing endoribonuclease RAMP protein Cas6 [Propionicicella superfundia]|uniref:CRISPR system precrRNA processing endoribonuclease RAMP protein Cas6 n=1 Tax=Propionicicella superfundia TaxID=348582 RepID=UPI00048AA514|nr:CRISPR system precrRNA processing endoribonuclease RAMP protein Cas6 [Propionicicella superfundia]